MSILLSTSFRGVAAWLLLLLGGGRLVEAAVLPAPRAFVRQFGPADGLRQPFSYCSLQDRQGYLWLGTAEGLVRYDGTQFITLTTHEGLAKDFVTGLWEEPVTGRLWVAHYQGGHSVWPLPGVAFRALVATTALPPGWHPPAPGAPTPDAARLRACLRRYPLHLPPEATPTCLLEDRAGNAWLGTAGQGLWRHSDRFASVVPASYAAAGTTLAAYPAGAATTVWGTAGRVGFLLTQESRTQLNSSLQRPVRVLLPQPRALGSGAWHGVTHGGIWLTAAPSAPAAHVPVTARDAAKASRRAKAQFLANISHEIHTPMNAVIGLTNLLPHTQAAREQGEYRSAIGSSSQNLLVILNDILESSKIEADKLSLEQISFRLPDAGCRFSTVFRYAADSEALPSISIAASKLSAIFEDFSQANSSTTHEFGGTSLGLSIARNLVQLHGGQLDVRSAEGIGSEFFFELTYPVADPALAQPEARTGPLPAFEPAMRHARLAYFTGRQATTSARADALPPSALGESPSASPPMLQPNWQLLEELACSNQSFIQQIVNTFLDEAPYLGVLLAAAFPHDAAKLAQVAHKLRGQVAYFGMPVLHTQFDELERTARRDDCQYCVPLLLAIRQQLAQLYPHLQERT